MSFQCTRCGASVKDENGVLISGKYYGPDCAATILGMKELPKWFKAGDWEVQLQDRNKADDAIRQQRMEREARMAQNWPLIHSISTAYQNARRNEKQWEISFLQSIAGKLGMQFCKESAYLYDNFQAFIKNQNNFPEDIQDLGALTDKQREVLNRIIG